MLSSPLEKCLGTHVQYIYCWHACPSMVIFFQAIKSNVYSVYILMDKTLMYRVCLMVNICQYAITTLKAAVLSSIMKFYTSACR